MLALAGFKKKKEAAGNPAASPIVGNYL